MEKKITSKLFLMGIVVALITCILTIISLKSGFEKQVENDLKTSANILAIAYEKIQNPAELKNYSPNSLRVTLISPTGKVLFESEKVNGEPENHLSRPEIKSAINETFGASKRVSKTTGEKYFYYALLMQDGNILRASISTNGMLLQFLNTYPLIVLMIVLIIVLSIIMAIFLTKSLVKPILSLSKNIYDEDIIKDESKVYNELVPFVAEIQEQHKKIDDQIKAIEIERNKISAIVSNMAEGLIVLDTEKKLVIVNESAQKYFEVENNVIGQNVLYLTRDVRINEYIDKALKGKKINVNIKKDGIWFQLMINPLVKDEKVVAVTCFLLDVTHKMQVEQMKQEFTANVSHELKTPLTSILGYSQMIENGMAKPQDITQFAGKISNEATRLLNLIADIIKLSQMDEVLEEPNFEENVNLYQIAKETIESLEMVASEQEIVFILCGKDEFVAGNETLLRELVYNLCDNAIRYNKEKGTVKITIENKKITVCDTGIGIPPESQPRIFERFFRVDKSRSKETGGTGLGLAIVKHIALTHGAEVTLKSQLDEGTEIIVDFEKGQKNEDIN